MAPLITQAAKTPEATLAIRALAPTVMITAILSSYRGYFLGRRYVSANALSKILEQLINVAVSLGGAYFLVMVDLAYGVAGVTLGSCVGALFAVILLVREFHKARLHKIRRSDQDVNAYHHTSKELVKKLLSYSVPITISAGMIHLLGF